MDKVDNKEGGSKEVEPLPQRSGNYYSEISALGRMLRTRNERGPSQKLEITGRDILLVIVGLLVGIAIGIVLTFQGIGVGIFQLNPQRGAVWNSIF